MSLCNQFAFIVVWSLILYNLSLEATIILAYNVWGSLQWETLSVHISSVGLYCFNTDGYYESFPFVNRQACHVISRACVHLQRVNENESKYAQMLQHISLHDWNASLISHSLFFIHLQTAVYIIIFVSLVQLDRVEMMM